MTSWLPKVRVAACNVAPVFLNAEKTVQKTVGLIREAATNRADLVVFPETYIPAYPLWAGIAAPIDNHHFFNHLARESLTINSPHIRTIRESCAQNKIFAHVGFNERSPHSLGCIWNSAILINDEGKIVNHQRKLMPTWFEKLVWAPGDGKGLKVVDTGRCGKVGALLCGENTNPLARWSLMAQGEQIHVTTWPPVWPTKRAPAAGTKVQGKPYDNLAANRTRTAAHCFEAKSFGVMCSGFMDKEMRNAITASHPSAAATIDSLTQGASLFLDPTGAPVGDQVQGEEGIAYADLDLNACVEPKQFHDVVGSGYQRYDVFDLKVDRRRQGPDRVFEDEDEYEDPVVEDRVERAVSRVEKVASGVEKTVSEAQRAVAPEVARAADLTGHSDFDSEIDGEITGKLHRKVHQDAHEGVDNKGWFDGSSDIPVREVLKGPVAIKTDGKVTAKADAEIKIRADGEIDGMLDGKLVNRVHEDAHEAVDDKGWFEGAVDGQVNAIASGPFEGKTDGTLIDEVHGRVDGEIDGMLDGKLVNRVHEDAHEAVDNKGWFEGSADGQVNAVPSGPFEGKTDAPIFDHLHGRIDGEIEGMLDGNKLVNRVHEDAHEGVNKKGFFK